MKLTPIAQELRNAYEAHDHDAFHAAVGRVVLLEQGGARPTPGHDCARGSACVCVSASEREGCTYRSARGMGIV